jgi:hypothetical protein
MLVYNSHGGTCHKQAQFLEAEHISIGIPYALRPGSSADMQEISLIPYTEKPLPLEFHTYGVLAAIVEIFGWNGAKMYTQVASNPKRRDIVVLNNKERSHIVAISALS